jgi:hypothetical protein
VREAFGYAKFSADGGRDFESRKFHRVSVQPIRSDKKRAHDLYCVRERAISIHASLHGMSVTSRRHLQQTDTAFAPSKHPISATLYAHA